MSNEETKYMPNNVIKFTDFTTEDKRLVAEYKNLDENLNEVKEKIRPYIAEEKCLFAMIEELHKNSNFVTLKNKKEEITKELNEIHKKLYYNRFEFILSRIYSFYVFLKNDMENASKRKSREDKMKSFLMSKGFNFIEDEYDLEYFLNKIFIEKRNSFCTFSLNEDLVFLKETYYYKNDYDGEFSIEIPIDICKDLKSVLTFTDSFYNFMQALLKEEEEERVLMNREKDKNEYELYLKLKEKFELKGDS